LIAVIINAIAHFLWDASASSTIIQNRFVDPSIAVVVESIASFTTFAAWIDSDAPLTVWIARRANGTFIIASPVSVDVAIVEADGSTGLAIKTARFSLWAFIDADILCFVDATGASAAILVDDPVTITVATTALIWTRLWDSGDTIIDNATVDTLGDSSPCTLTGATGCDLRLCIFVDATVTVIIKCITEISTSTVRGAGDACLAIGVTLCSSWARIFAYALVIHRTLLRSKLNTGLTLGVADQSVRTAVLAHTIPID